MVAAAAAAATLAAGAVAAQPVPPPAAYGAPPRWHEPFGWDAPQVDGFDLLYIDDAPLLLSNAVPAGGPSQRLTSRPGAWYTALFLPLVPGRPVQLWFSQRLRTHELRVTALDASPLGPVTVAVPLPLMLAPSRSGARNALVSAPFGLPAASQADGVFLLIEQWSLAGDAPGLAWIQARSRLQRIRDARLWWQHAPADTAPQPAPLAPPSPPSPLNAPRDAASGAIDLPIFRRLRPP